MRALSSIILELNNIQGNNITDSYRGVLIDDEFGTFGTEPRPNATSNNTIYLNNFVNNSVQVFAILTEYLSKSPSPNSPHFNLSIPLSRILGITAEKATSGATTMEQIAMAMA